MYFTILLIKFGGTVETSISHWVKEGLKAGCVYPLSKCYYLLIFLAFILAFGLEPCRRRPGWSANRYLNCIYK